MLSFSKSSPLSHAKPLLPCKITYWQIPGIRAWISFGEWGIILSTTDCNLCHWSSCLSLPGVGDCHLPETGSISDWPCFTPLWERVRAMCLLQIQWWPNVILWKGMSGPESCRGTAPYKPFLIPSTTIFFLLSWSASYPHCFVFLPLASPLSSKPIYSTINISMNGTECSIAVCQISKGIRSGL